MKSAIFACVAVLGLTACSTFDPPKQIQNPETLPLQDGGSMSPFQWRPTECSGKTCARIWLPSAEDGGAAVAEIVDGKDRGGVTVTRNPDGSISYSAQEVVGIPAQNFPLQADAALAQSLGEMWATLAPEIKTGVICSLGIALGVPTACAEGGT